MKFILEIDVEDCLNCPFHFWSKWGAYDESNSEFCNINLKDYSTDDNYSNMDMPKDCPLITNDFTLYPTVKPINNVTTRLDSLERECNILRKRTVNLTHSITYIFKCLEEDDDEENDTSIWDECGGTHEYRTD